MKSLFTPFFVLVAIISSAQEVQPVANWVKMMQDPTASIFETKKEFDAYWSGKKIEKGKGFNQFLRWQNYMYPRVFPSGNVTLPSQNAQNFIDWEKNNKGYNEKVLTFSSWSSLGPNGKPVGPKAGAGRLNFLRFHPTTPATMWVGTPDGGLWKTVNGGSSWTTNTGFLPAIGISDLAIHPTIPQTMFLATGDSHGFDCYSVGVYKTTNGGTNWDPTAFTAATQTGLLIRKLVINPTNPQIMWAATNQGIYRTLNAFQTAPTMVQAGNFYDLELKPGSPSVVYISGTKFMKSTNFGLNFSLITSVFPQENNTSRIEIAVTPANPSRVYLQIGSVFGNGLDGIYSSTNSGIAFNQVKYGTNPNTFGYQPDGSDAGGQGHYANAFAVSPIAESILFGGSINIWKSVNSGVTWNINSHWDQQAGLPFVHADIHDIQFFPGSSTTLFVLTDGGIVKSIDGGTTWTDITANLSIAQVYRIAPSATNANFLLAGHQDNGSNSAIGLAWTNIFGGDGMDCLVDRTNSANYIISTQYGTYYRKVGNDYLLVPFYGIPDGYGSGVEWLCPLQQDPVNANIIYAGGRTNLYKSLDFSANWTQLGVIGGIGNVLEFAVAPSNPQILYAVKNGGVFKSINGGLNWSNISGTNSPSNPSQALIPTGIIVSPSNPNKVWVSYSGYDLSSKVYTTSNGGTTWTNLSAGLPNLPVNVIRLIPSSTEEILVVGTDVCIYTKRANTAWTMVSGATMPRVEVRDIKFSGTGNNLKMFAATFGRGVYVCNITDVFSTPKIVEEVSPYQFKEELVLLYPNPSKGIFSIASNNEIKQIEILEISGKIIETVSFKAAANKSEINLSFLPKGNYFLKIQMENSVEIKQVIIE
jgi:photosystem II stability/assembly factor-like uncharacterized protein